MNDNAVSWIAKRTPANSMASTVRLLSRHKELRISDVLDLLSDDESFRGFFTLSIISASYGAYFWEACPISEESLGKTFEYCQTKASFLAGIEADPGPFSNQFGLAGSSSVLAFKNMGGDATLIVPRPISSDTIYGHLSGFLLSATAAQISDFWKLAATTIKAQRSSAPLWLSTAGLGVSWLHLRIDSRPKYFRYEPYKDPEFICP